MGHIAGQESVSRPLHVRAWRSEGSGCASDDRLRAVDRGENTLLLVNSEGHVIMVARLEGEHQNVWGVVER